MLYNQDLRELAYYRGVGFVQNSVELDNCIYQQMTPRERRVYWWHVIKVYGVATLLFSPLEIALEWNGWVLSGLNLALAVIVFCAVLCRPHYKALEEYKMLRAEEIARKNAAIRAKRIEEGL